MIPDSTLTILVLQWSEVTETGNSPILSYHLQSQEQEQDSWLDVKGEEGTYDTLTRYDVEGLDANKVYNFRVRARNAHGWSSLYSGEY